MSLFAEIVKHVPVDIETAMDTYGRRVDMQDDRERIAFLHHWAKLNTEFAGILVDATVRRSREYQMRMAAAGVDASQGRAA